MLTHSWLHGVASVAENSTVAMPNELFSIFVSPVSTFSEVTCTPLELVLLVMLFAHHTLHPYHLRQRALTFRHLDQPEHESNPPSHLATDYHVFLDVLD